MSKKMGSVWAAAELARTCAQRQHTGCCQNRHARRRRCTAQRRTSVTSSRLWCFLTFCTLAACFFSFQILAAYLGSSGISCDASTSIVSVSRDM